MKDKQVTSLTNNTVITEAFSREISQHWAAVHLVSVLCQHLACFWWEKVRNWEILWMITRERYMGKWDKLNEGWNVTLEVCHLPWMLCQVVNIQHPVELIQMASGQTNIGISLRWVMAVGEAGRRWIWKGAVSCYHSKRCQPDKQ